MLLSVDFDPAITELREENLDMIKKTGFDGLDFAVKPSLLGEDFRENAAQVRTMLDRAGLTCVQAHAPHNFVFGTEMSCDNTEYRDTFRALEFAGILGTKYVVVHGSPVPDGPLSGQFIEHNYRYYKSFEEEARRCGVYIGVENLKYGILPFPAYVNRLLRLLDSDVFYPHVDLGHAALVGVEPDVFLRSLTVGPVRAIHVHDFDLQTDHTFPYLGKSKWGNVVKALADIGYEGDLSLELFVTVKHIRDYSPELLPAFYEMAAAVGKELIGQIETERKERAVR